MKKAIIYSSIFLLIVLLGAFAAYRYVLPGFVVVDASYAAVTAESMMRDADLIFLGEVVDISPTRWNQDNGRYWDDGMPYYHVTVSVIEPIVGEAKREVVLTVLETSPVGDASQTIESDESAGQGDKHLQVGDRAVFFAQQVEIAWRNPERLPATVFMGYPQGDTFLKGADDRYHSMDGESFSLDELTAEIAQKRTD